MSLNIDCQVQYAMQAYLERELKGERRNLQAYKLFDFDKAFVTQGRIAALSEALDMLFRLQVNGRRLAEEQALLIPNLIDL